MTIYLYSGTPGSGKSYHATDDMRLSLIRGRKPIVCNYDIRHDFNNYENLYHYKPNDVLDPDWLVKFAEDWWKSHPFKEDSIILVIDECQLLFNSREWQNPRRMAWLQFFSQHRHYGYKVIFIAQSDKMIDRQFRALLEYDVIHRKLANFGLAGKILSLVALGRVFTAITKYYGASERVGVNFFVVRKRTTRLYNSYSTFKRLGDGGRASAGHRREEEGPARARAAATRRAKVAPEPA